ncbi:MAG TPA: hypothetical protein PLS03_16770, partial [Terrimicrobiaceae bacterium]|nr:hypothetical protein [Terrimicrobiaceae bacterium]
MDKQFHNNQAKRRRTDKPSQKNPRLGEVRPKIFGKLIRPAEEQSHAHSSGERDTGQNSLYQMC